MYVVFLQQLARRAAQLDLASPPATLPRNPTAMQKTAQSWFTGGSPDAAAAASESQPSLLADWNSYAAERSDASSSSPLPFDIELAVRSANNTFSGTFSM